MPMSALRKRCRAPDPQARRWLVLSAPGRSAMIEKALAVLRFDGLSRVIFMRSKSRPQRVKVATTAPKVSPSEGAVIESPKKRAYSRRALVTATAAVTLPLATALAYLAYDHYRIVRLTRTVKQLFAARRYSAAHE